MYESVNTTKGSVGTTTLGLAVDAGLVKLDDLATKYDPDLGTEKKENAETGWLKDVTIRQLATMTAGFDDGRPPRLVYKPGTKGIYSNDTSNMLAEVLAARFGEDLRGVLKRKVMDPIGVPEGEWVWRANQFRPEARGGLATREFASGIRITHRALARIGWLYLNDGEGLNRIQGGVLNGYTIGLNWYLNENAKLQFDYVYDQRSDLPPGSIPGSTRGLGMRMQFNY